MTRSGQHISWIAVLSIIGLIVGTTSITTAQINDDDSGDSVQNEAFELEVIRLTNLERTSRGLPPLRRNGDLTNAARAHNQDMIVNDFFSHQGSNGSWPDERACAHGFAPYGWGDCYVGENIAAGYPTPAAVVVGWMNSQGHRENILNGGYREIGLGHNTGGSWGQYWTMALGSQPLVLPVFINDDAAETETRAVTLTLTRENISSWGSIGAITGVKISEDPTFAGAAWQSWAQAKPFTLSIGNETKTVYVKFTDGSTEVDSSDSIVLNEPLPTLSVSPLTPTFLAELGSGQTIPLTQTLMILNVGGGSLNWTAVSGASWLLPAADSGMAPGSVALTVDNSGGILNSLGEATTTMTVTATTADAQNTPQIVPVTVRVVETLYSTYLPLIQRQ